MTEPATQTRVKFVALRMAAAAVRLGENPDALKQSLADIVDSEARQVQQDRENAQRAAEQQARAEAETAALFADYFGGDA